MSDPAGPNRLSGGQRHGPLLGGGPGGGRRRGRPVAGRARARRWPTCCRGPRRCTPTGRGSPRCWRSARCWSATGPWARARPGRRTARAGRHRRAAAAVRRRLRKLSRRAVLTCPHCRPSRFFTYGLAVFACYTGAQSSCRAIRGRGPTDASGRSVTSQGDRPEALLPQPRPSHRRGRGINPPSARGWAGHEPRSLGPRRGPGRSPRAFGVWRAARDGRFRGTHALPTRPSRTLPILRAPRARPAGRSRPPAG